MKRIYTLIILLLVAHLSQGQYLKMATISSWGGTSSSGNYMSQVVGQSSVIAGTESKQGTVFRQGFKQPFGLQKTIAKANTLPIYSEETPWSFETFPNPFLDHLTVRFDRPTSYPVVLQVYDNQGQVVWQGDYPEKIKEIRLEKFQDIKIGKYILKVYQKDKVLNQSLIKQIN